MTILRGPLDGLRVAITRSPDRAGALADALAAAGAEPVLVPVIDFEVADNDALGAALRRLSAGDYRWLVISSITTVRALKQWCEGAGTSLSELIPAGTSVATIGPTSAAVLAAEGIHAELAPVDIQSAAGLVDLWPEFEPNTLSLSSNNKILLPQSNLAEATLVTGMNAKGWDSEIVTAYQTVHFPAKAELRLQATLNNSQGHTNAGYPVLTPAQAAGEIAAGAIGAVVLASGSAARRVAETMAPLTDNCLVIAIGQPTQLEAHRLGLRVAATAKHPTPEGIVAALAQAHTNFHTQ
ncbi:uroporphyrinogen-III synthase [Arthrobacter antibioticus]|uniref:uroporphyrinogen-III synthase n=1 Tax=Arthrobacter sp. H35-MC1 TaxID=3046203 RepID=UPI0024B8EC8B|nr:uroporphyrinogen-III synthase [Arthrobacter sp. H35-MC1]MDJ0317526.1 uroporphyrinogen-III synthase [Arthrobacter sp. H35-MC1]